LRSIEFNCGLAYGTLSDNRNVDKTAEEIRASKQRSYSMVCDIQNSLKNALLDLIYAMSVYCDMYSLAPKGECNTSFNFDDSIICDRAIEFDERLTLLEKGVLSPWEMRSWYFQEDEKLAKQRVGEISEV
ncbi:MAG: phage portal protein, partial [Clostridia bacterium]|nr:phage portal protein [Clostridia bacterium]